MTTSKSIKGLKGIKVLNKPSRVEVKLRAMLAQGYVIAGIACGGDEDIMLFSAVSYEDLCESARVRGYAVNPRPLPHLLRLADNLSPKQVATALIKGNGLLYTWPSPDYGGEVTIA